MRPWGLVLFGSDPGGIRGWVGIVVCIVGAHRDRTNAEGYGVPPSTYTIPNMFPPPLLVSIFNDSETADYDLFAC